MRRFFVALAVAHGSAYALAACAADDPRDVAGESVDVVLPPSSTGEAGPDARATDDCEECRIFPEGCEPGSFCPVSVPLETSDRLLAAVGRTTSDVWVGGSMGALLHFDGTAWAREAMPRRETFAALLFRSADEIWLGGTLALSYVKTSAIADGGQGAWAPVSNQLGGPSTGIQALWSAPDGRWVWVGLANGNALRQRTLLRVRREGARLVEGGAVAIPGPMFLAMNGLDGLSRDEVWAVGEGGKAYRLRAADGDSPVVTEFNTQTSAALNSVAVLSPEDVWAVGNVGTIRHYRAAGTSFDREDDVPTIETLRGIKAGSPSDVWAVGDRATILHFDGAKWVRHPIGGLYGLRPDLHAVLALKGERVIVVGERIVLELRLGTGG